MVVILILGIIILGWGAIQFGANQQKKIEHRYSGYDIAKMNNEMFRIENEVNANDERGRKREQVPRIMIAGAIVFIIGGGLRYSSKN